MPLEASRGVAASLSLNYYSDFEIIDPYGYIPDFYIRRVEVVMGIKIVKNPSNLLIKLFTPHNP